MIAWQEQGINIALKIMLWHFKQIVILLHLCESYSFGYDVLPDFMVEKHLKNFHWHFPIANII